MVPPVVFPVDVEACEFMPNPVPKAVPITVYAPRSFGRVTNNLTALRAARTNTARRSDAISFLRMTALVKEVEVNKSWAELPLVSEVPLSCITDLKQVNPADEDCLDTVATKLCTPFADSCHARCKSATLVGAAGRSLLASRRPNFKGTECNVSESGLKPRVPCTPQSVWARKPVNVARRVIIPAPLSAH